MENNIFEEIQSKSRDELNIIAKKLKVNSYRRLNREKLIEKLLHQGEVDNIF